MRNIFIITVITISLLCAQSDKVLVSILDFDGEGITIILNILLEWQMKDIQ